MLAPTSALRRHWYPVLSAICSALTVAWTRIQEAAWAATLGDDVHRKIPIAEPTVISCTALKVN